MSLPFSQFQDLKSIAGQLAVRLTTCAGGTPLTAERRLTDPDLFDFAGSCWGVQASVEPEDDGFSVFLRCESFRDAGPVGVSLDVEIAGWSKENYVLLPGAAYQGNRFRKVKSRYVEQFDSPGPDMPLTMTDQPGLNPGEGESRMDFRTGDLTTPATGIHFAHLNRGFLLFTEQGTCFGDSGISFQESQDRTRATVSVSAPCLRPGEYGRIRGDRAPCWKVGDAVEIRLKIFVFPSRDINHLFREYFRRRNVFSRSEIRNEVPFSHCWDLLEKKYNSQNWVEEYGYFSVGMRESAPQDWQTGWVGGLNALFPLLCGAGRGTRERAMRTFDFLFPCGQFPSGYFKECFHRGDWVWAGRPILQRTNGDVLYFLLKCFRLLEARGEAPVSPGWKDGALRCARAFCKTWKDFGQFGHRVDGETGAVVFGGTTSAGIAPGALALAADYFGEGEFLKIASDAAEHFHRDYVSRGITNAGPGDILQCPDSESAAGLLESYVTLFEVTGDRGWIDKARDCAHHLASWTMTYDFTFPLDSTFGRMGMLTTGTVFANIQNKHSAPGICSLSGNSLLKLFRATGDVAYLELIRSIAHAIPQYMSRADRPIRDRRPGQRWPVMPPGWINERVNTSDWEVRGNPDADIGVGEIFGGSTWSEVAMLLTAAELPGIYWQPDTGLLRTLDHVEAHAQEGSLVLTNPTPFPASVKVFAESSAQTQHPLGPLAWCECPRVRIEAHGSTAFFPPSPGNVNL